MNTRQIAPKRRIKDGRRRTANKTERLAAAYLMLKLGENWLIPEPLRSKGSAKEICRYVEADHNVLHAFGGGTNPQNINLLPAPVHREKSKVDKGKTAKADRLIASQEEFRRRLLTKLGEQIPPPPKPKRKRKMACSRDSNWKMTFKGAVRRTKR